MTAERQQDVEQAQKSLGRRIRALRGRRGWSQEELASVCGLHRTYMGHVERGEKNVSLSTILRVARGLGVRLPELFGRAYRNFAEPSAQRQPHPAGGMFPLTRVNVTQLLAELQSQRKALRRAIHDLVGLNPRR